mmetsp:Transcript_20239/g.51641  ORF Transcript_20239/g.51641 Transcript_20239/m.51641 type:complete len:236 (-) Transcript_20239:2234-2941(-)
MTTFSYARPASERARFTSCPNITLNTKVRHWSSLGSRTSLFSVPLPSSLTTSTWSRVVLQNSLYRNLAVGISKVPLMPGSDFLRSSTFFLTPFAVCPSAMCEWNSFGLTLFEVSSSSKNSDTSPRNVVRDFVSFSEMRCLFWRAFSFAVSSAGPSCSATNVFGLNLLGPFSYMGSSTTSSSSPPSSALFHFSRYFLSFHGLVVSSWDGVQSTKSLTRFGCVRSILSIRSSWSVGS